ncbi:MAG: hypothetical protein F4X44_10035 [Gammaproteobacteria bacterium]|nr:hypothetical protein [Gammaproteobacteria bacterium]MYD80937.1 hypothetical protein [Gammaproteobacteria bacterium]
MKKAGGIVAIAGGAVGLGVALGILMFENAYKNEEFTDSGNIATATPEVSTKGLQSGETETTITFVGRVVYVGWNCVVLSLATLGLGMWAFVAKNWMPGAGIIVASILGVVLGSVVMLVPMVITGIGGILALWPSARVTASEH